LYRYCARGHTGSQQLIDPSQNRVAKGTCNQGGKENTDPTVEAYVEDVRVKARDAEADEQAKAAEHTAEEIRVRSC